MATHRLRVLVALAGAAVTSCTRPPTSEEERIVAAVTRLIAAPAALTCVDRRTGGNALEIWRDARLVVLASGRRLGWSVPQPLRPPMSVERGVETADGRRMRVAEPLSRAPALPRAVEQRVEVAARRLVLADPDGPVTIPSGPGISSRWWVMHRLRRECPYAFHLSNPAWSGPIGAGAAKPGTIAFVAVDANHWATIYALERRVSGWYPLARWTPWMY